jgi:hypothetical protein
MQDSAANAPTQLVEGGVVESGLLLLGMFAVIDATLRLPLTEYGAQFATDICLARDSTTTIMTLKR